MLKNLFSSADERSDKATESLNSSEPTTRTATNVLIQIEASMTSTTAKQQLLSILQDTQVKLENSNSPSRRTAAPKSPQGYEN